MNPRELEDLWTLIIQSMGRTSSIEIDHKIQSSDSLDFTKDSIPEIASSLISNYKEAYKNTKYNVEEKYEDIFCSEVKKTLMDFHEQLLNYKLPSGTSEGMQLVAQSDDDYGNVMLFREYFDVRGNLRRQEARRVVICWNEKLEDAFKKTNSAVITDSQSVSDGT